MNVFYCLSRQKELLRILLLKDDWITGLQLSSMINITDRTIRNDITILNHILKQYNSTIVSIRGKGYRLETRNRDLLVSLLAHDSSDIPTTREERIRHIATKVLLSETAVFLEDIEDEMFISRTTLESDIKILRIMLSSYSPPLKLIKEDHKLLIEGSEYALRSLLSELILLKYDSQEGIFLVKEKVIASDTFRSILDIVISIMHKYNIFLTDDGIATLASYLAITNKRILQDKKLGKLDIREVEIQDQMYEIAIEITKQLSVRFKMIFDESEVLQIAVELSVMSILQPKSFSRKQIIAETEPRLVTIVESLLINIKNEFNVDLSNDDILFVGLVQHIKSLASRLNYKQTEPTPILFRNKYPFIFELALHICESFKKIFGSEPNENELCYIAAHLGAAIERLGYVYAQNSISIAVISHLSFSYTQLLMAKLKSIYGTTIQIHGPYPIYGWNDVVVSQPSIILSTSPSVHSYDSKGIPVLNISPMQETSYLNILNDLLSVIKKDGIFIQPSGEIEQYFEESLFFKDLSALTPEDTIHFLCDKLVERGYVPKDFCGQTMERERLTSTSFSNLIAIPHPIKACSYKTVVSVAVLNKPILWGQNKAQLIFLLAVREGDKQYIGRFFDFIIGLISDFSRVSNILNVNDFGSFFNLVKEYKK